MRSASLRRRSGASRRRSRSTRTSTAPGSGSKRCAASWRAARPSRARQRRASRHVGAISAEAGSVSDQGWLGHREEDDRLQVAVGGGWTVAALAQLDQAARAMLDALPGKTGLARIDLGALEALDTAGAWLLCRIQASLAERGWQVEIAAADTTQAALLAEIQRLKPRPALPPARINPLVRLLARLGASTLAACSEARRLLSFYGETVVTFGRLARHPQRMRVTSLVHHLEQTCLNALPIVGLIAFLIGVVLAYQGADQLRRFGAEVFTVNLLGVSVLREIGILLTAIVVAGRSGSAFTAEIGMMKVR